MQFERVFGAEFHPANPNSLLTRQESKSCRTVEGYVGAYKGAPGSECRTYTRLVSPAIGREKKKWNPLFFDKIRYLEFN